MKNISQVVVVIDDEEIVRNATTTLLEIWGCDVVSSANLAGALKTLDNTGASPKAVIADFRLNNGETGLDAIKQLRENYCNDLPAIVVTGDLSRQESDAIHSLKLEVLQKPIESSDLRSFLDSIN